jgi:hypothetical protein
MFISVHNTINVNKVIYKCRVPIPLLRVSNMSSILTLSTFTSLWMCNNASPFSLSSTIVVLFHYFRLLKAEKDLSFSVTVILDIFLNLIFSFIYIFNSHMRIDKQITNIIPYWIHVFIQDRGAYKHKNACIVFILYFFSEKYLKTTIYRL